MDIVDYTYKIIIIGDSGTGKTSILSQAINGKFDDFHNLTIGVEYGSKKYRLPNENLYVKLQIWDTAGQETYRAITRTYYKKAFGALVVFNLTNYSSFKNIDMWLQELKDSCDNENLQCILIGNKKDLKNRVVSFDEATKLAKKHGLDYYEISSKNNDECCKMFENIANKIAYYNDHKKPQVFDSFPILKPVSAPKKKCCYL